MLDADALVRGVVMDANAHTPDNASGSSQTSVEGDRNTAATTVKQETPKSFAVFLLQLLIAVLIFRSFIFAPFSIPSESMLPRLMTGDLILAAKWPYGYSQYSLPFSAPLIPDRVLASEPERGDIVIFKHPVDKADYIKRVIGLPGDTIEVEDSVVILNGQPLAQTPLSDAAVDISPNTQCPGRARTYELSDGQLVCRYTQFSETLPGGNEHTILDLGLDEDADFYGPVTVPEGHMFVMGDNRDRSQDSRFETEAGMGVGIVPQELLVGEASIILWSSEGSAIWYDPVSWFATVRWSRLGTVL
jgi:signal peptidase I